MHAAAPSSVLIDRLYTQHHGWLHNWLWHKLGCRDGAADLAHDTFLRVLTAAPEQALREPRAYLSTIAQGLLVSRWRRLTLERRYLAELAELPAGAAASPEDTALAVELLVRIDTMLGELSANARQAFLLAQIDGLTYTQIAAQLGVSDRMIKKYMAQAMLQCALLIGDDAP